MKKLLIGAFFCISVQLAYAKAPELSDYPVKVYNGVSAKLVLSNDIAKTFQTNFRNALKRKPNFAGEYIATTWGCGGGCVAVGIINKRTGVVVDTTFDGDGEEFIEEMEPNSSLLISKETVMDNSYNLIGKKLNYYTINNSKLKLIKQVAVKGGL